MSQHPDHPPLDEQHVDADPLLQLQSWLDAARAANMIEPTAMTLATVDAEGHPSARVVLYKGLYQGGLTFYTNYEGRKGRELLDNPNVALVFWWDKLERQVRVEGRVTRLPRELSQQYFHSRRRESQLGAISSQQSAVVSSREELERRYDANAERYRDGEVPLPDFWGGYRVEPHSIEFWQGRLGRLHDRLRYRRDAAQPWRIERLQP